MADEQKKKPKSGLTLAFALGAGAGAGGQQIAVDSPIHLTTTNVEPAASSEEWVCEPEGGIVGAMIVCTFKPRAPVETPDAPDAGP